jgi:hypothetical protein
MTLESINPRNREHMDSKFLRKIMSGLKCGVCGRGYETDKINVLGYQGDVWFLNVSCTSCNSLALIAATFKQDKLNPPITDLTQAELPKFSEVGEITADDIINIHSYLREFDGDFVKLFDRS